MGQARKRGVDIWEAIRGMIAPVLERWRKRYPGSRRRVLLERLMAAANAEDPAELMTAGEEFLALTGEVPPGFYVESRTLPPRYLLSGQRVVGRRRGEDWAIHPYHPQVWR